MKLSYKTFKIIMGTIIDRSEVKLDRAIHKPFNNRMLLSSPNEFISKMSEQIILSKSEVSEGNILNYINSNQVLEQIENELKVNLPDSRKEVLKTFRYNKDWISILESVYAIIRLLKPDLVVETGVGEIGMSSTYILTALEDNNKGHLYSIDPDKFYLLYGYHIGSGIPENLRKRHTIIKDISQTALEPLLRKIGQIDVFLHDGDHRFRTKLFEYETAYKYLKNGGVIMSDDTWDSAFDLFVRKYKINGYSVKYNTNDFFSYAYIRNDVQ